MHHLQQKNSREMTHLTTERHLAQNLHPTEKKTTEIWIQMYWLKLAPNQGVLEAILPTESGRNVKLTTPPYVWPSLMLRGAVTTLYYVFVP